MSSFDVVTNVAFAVLILMDDSDGRAEHTINCRSDSKWIERRCDTSVEGDLRGPEALREPTPLEHLHRHRIGSLRRYCKEVSMHNASPRERHTASPLCPAERGIRVMSASRPRVGSRKSYLLHPGYLNLELSLAEGADDLKVFYEDREAEGGHAGHTLGSCGTHGNTSHLFEVFCCYSSDTIVSQLSRVCPPTWFLIHPLRILRGACVTEYGELQIPASGWREWANCRHLLA